METVYCEVGSTSIYDLKWATSCDICGEWSGTGTISSPNNSVFPSRKHSTSPSYSSSSTRCFYLKDKWARSGNLPKAMLFRKSEIREHWAEKYFHIFCLQRINQDCVLPSCVKISVRHTFKRVCSYRRRNQNWIPVVLRRTNFSRFFPHSRVAEGCEAVGELAVPDFQKEM